MNGRHRIGARLLHRRSRRKTAVAIRHVACEDLGNLADVLYANGFDVSYLEAGIDNLASTEAQDADLLVILGGPVGAYEEQRYPYLRDELMLLEQRLALDAPTIGICLGAQLIARVLGSRVYPGEHKEIGWAPLILSAAGRRSPLVHLANTPVLHWHGDTFDCPRGATHLAASSFYVQQAFSWRARCLALQFHPEVTQGRLERRLLSRAHEIATSGCDVIRLREDAGRHATALRRAARSFWQDWLERCCKVREDSTAPPIGTDALRIVRQPYYH